MPKTAQPARPPRADARRNRERILEAAKAAFTRSGADASLDEIARQAGVGPGTLYRHFPARADLLAAVYEAEMEKLAAAERRLSASMPPVAALRAWLLLFVDAIATKQIIGPALNSMVGAPVGRERGGAPCAVMEAAHARLRQAVRALVERAVRSGELRPDLDPVDLLRALIGVANVASGPGWRKSAQRLVEILVTGSRVVS